MKGQGNIGWSTNNDRFEEVDVGTSFILQQLDSFSLPPVLVSLFPQRALSYH